MAIDICGKTGFRPELALARLHLAELLLNLTSVVAARPSPAFRGEGGIGTPDDDPAFMAKVLASEAELRRPEAELRKEAMGYLEAAIMEFRDMKMQPSLERALKRKEIPKA